MDVKVEQYEHEKHYLRFAPLFCRYYREINNENIEMETSVLLNGKLTVVKRYDAEIHGMALQGVFCKVAIVDDEIVGFIWYRACLHHFILPIDSFYVRKEFRATGVGLALINSFCNDFNRGWFEIVAFIHENKRPEEMLGAFHGWEQVRVCNDRDLVMIRGHWDVHLYQKAKNSDLTGRGTEHVTVLKPRSGTSVLEGIAEPGRGDADRKHGARGRTGARGNGSRPTTADGGTDAPVAGPAGT